MKVYIFGAKGMLGRYVQNALSCFEIVPLSRSDFDINNYEKIQSYLHNIGMENDDVIVNCAAILRSRIADVGIEETLKVNSLFPHALSNYCNKHDIKLIHLSTDTVFSGRRGKYNENDEHDAIDQYGKTKSLGEPENATVIRTSIIGEEVGQKRSLLEWVRSHKGTVNGYVDHWWNGITCYQLASIIAEIIDKELYWNGGRHIFSPEIINKYQLICHINEIYELGLSVSQHHAGYCNRSLETIYKKQFDIPSIRDQIIYLRNRILT